MRPLAFDVTERSRLVPDRVGNTEPAEVVQQPSPPQHDPARLRNAGALRRLGREGGNATTVPGEVRRLEVDEVRHGLEHPVELGTRRAVRR